jgi:GntP family gluconate:H+ symporter
MIDIVIFIGVIIVLIASISFFRIHPFFALLLCGLGLGMAMGFTATQSLEHLLTGFAKTLEWIGIVMILGTIIGEILNETGSSVRIAKGTLKMVGEKRLPLTMGLTGYVISIPVFVDVAYIMMQSITEALTVQSKRNILTVGLSLVAGLTASHALVPPTPGPLAIVGIVQADLGRVILINLMVAIFAMTGGLLWAVYYCRRFKLPYDKKIREQYQNQKSEIETESAGKTVRAFLPIFLPLLLIAARSFIPTDTEHILSRIFIFLGTPFMALCIGILIALLQFKKGERRKRLFQITERSIEKAALVIMITGAGGAFGHIIQATPMGETLGSIVSKMGILGMFFPFLLAATFTTATGSLTVSMITSASIVMPLLPSLQMSPELAVALIGCGSFCVFHVNSSFYWLLNRLHQVPPNILFRTFTAQSLCMGLGGLLCVILLRVFGLVN